MEQNLRGFLDLNTKWHEILTSTQPASVSDIKAKPKLAPFWNNFAQHFVFNSFSFLVSWRIVTRHSSDFSWKRLGSIGECKCHSTMTFEWSVRAEKQLPSSGAVGKKRFPKIMRNKIYWKVCGSALTVVSPKKKSYFRFEFRAILHCMYAWVSDDIDISLSQIHPISPFLRKIAQKKNVWNAISGLLWNFLPLLPPSSYIFLPIPPPHLLFYLLFSSSFSSSSTRQSAVAVKMSSFVMVAYQSIWLWYYWH